MTTSSATMIDCHDFNTRWWGADVGIVRDPLFFELSAEHRDSLLAQFAWAEWRAPNGHRPGGPEAAGFWWADVQVHFSIALGDVKAPCSQDALEVRPGPFDPSARLFEPFTHERFNLLPGITRERVTARYKLWASDLIATAPSWCVELHHDGLAQGFHCAIPSARGLHLALFGRYIGATVPGRTLYHAVLASYAARGATVGYAAYSIGNVAAQKIYVGAGARTVGIEPCWLWTRKTPGDPVPADPPAIETLGTHSASRQPRRHADQP
jgi:hypothetical protein